MESLIEAGFAEELGGATDVVGAPQTADAANKMRANCCIDRIGFTDVSIPNG